MAPVPGMNPGAPLDFVFNLPWTGECAAHIVVRIMTELDTLVQPSCHAHSQ